MATAKKVITERLSEPFALHDIKWAMLEAWDDGRDIQCKVMAYVTARAVQQRLDDVCGVDGWTNTTPEAIDVNAKSVYRVGISIRFSTGSASGTSGWMTKWDVSGVTSLEPEKGGYSSAFKRAAVQWGIGRYLYLLPPMYAIETQRSRTEGGPGRQWQSSCLPNGGQRFWWLPPPLPSWALQKDEAEEAVSVEEVYALVRKWRESGFADGCDTSAARREAFRLFVSQVLFPNGGFPVGDHRFWTRSALDKCASAVEKGLAPARGIDVPLEANNDVENE